MNKFGAFKLGIISAGFLAISACSHTGNGDDYAEVTNGAVPGSDTVYASGLGYNEPFPGQNAGSVDSMTGEKANTVYFSYDQSAVAPEYQEIVEANARYLKSHPEARVRLDGHTDPRGSREYNIGLGERRGRSIDYQLQLLGVARDQMTVVSYGKEKLAAPGNTAEDYRLDRRVEIIYENQG